MIPAFEFIEYVLRICIAQAADMNAVPVDHDHTRDESLANKTMNDGLNCYSVGVYEVVHRLFVSGAA